MLYEGKAKRVTVHAEGEVCIHYKDECTAFNGQKKEQFGGKGELNSQITEKLFGYLAEGGVPTHHLGRIDARSLRARRVTIVPLETVVRFRVAGSLQKRTGLPYLHACEPALVEFYYKRDDLGDPHLADDHVRLLGLATPPELATLRAMSLDAAHRLRELFAAARIDLVDLKFEFGRTASGELLLADEISPDTCRFRDMDTGEVLDKDLFRFGGGDLMTGYQKLLARLDAALAARPPAAGGTARKIPLDLVVRPRPGVKDPQAEAVGESLTRLGFTGCEVASVGRVLSMSVPAASESEARRLADACCRELLVNPSLETYELALRGKVTP